MEEDRHCRDAARISLSEEEGGGEGESSTGRTTYDAGEGGWGEKVGGDDGDYRPPVATMTTGTFTAYKEDEGEIPWRAVPHHPINFCALVALSVLFLKCIEGWTVLVRCNALLTSGIACALLGRRLRIPHRDRRRRTVVVADARSSFRWDAPGDGGPVAAPDVDHDK